MFVEGSLQSGGLCFILGSGKFDLEAFLWLEFSKRPKI